MPNGHVIYLKKANTPLALVGVTDVRCAAAAAGRRRRRRGNLSARPVGLTETDGGSDLPTTEHLAGGLPGLNIEAWMMLLGIKLMLLLAAAASYAAAAAAAADVIDCSPWNCSCQDYADRFGMIACIPPPPAGGTCGFGCAPKSTYSWWVGKKCTAHTSGAYCGGAGCKAPSAAPCAPAGRPLPSPPPPPPPCPRPSPDANYSAQWCSVATHPMPQWFEDAKFGIYAHWGPYSVPAFGSEWISRYPITPR